MQVGLFKADGAASMEDITVYRTGLGDLRIHVPIARTMNIAMIGLPLAKFARSGVLHGVVVQTGRDVSKASKSEDIRAIADDMLVFGGLERNGRHYHASNEDGCLIVPVLPVENEISIYTVALTSLSHDRIRSTAYDGTDGAPIEVAEPQQETSRQPLTA
jgi:hypothetical protein